MSTCHPHATQDPQGCRRWPERLDWCLPTRCSNERLRHPSRKSSDHPARQGQPHHPPRPAAAGRDPQLCQSVLNASEVTMKTIILGALALMSVISIAPSAAQDASGIEAYEIAKDAYVYTYPLLLDDVFVQQGANYAEPTGIVTQAP